MTPMLASERRERLDALGFVWNALTDQWDKGFEALQSFHQREGHCRVPRHHREQGYPLGAWIATQRAYKEVRLTPERRERLDALGFVWNASTVRWDEGFKALQSFHQREGHCRVPAEHRERNYPLASWVGTQRVYKYRLTPERQKRLDALGFVWSGQAAAHAAQWDKGFKALQSFHQREGHCRVPRCYRDGTFPLGHWVATQRCVKARLPPERRKQLEALGFEWRLRERRKASPHSKKPST
jgi:predicted DNA-binding protein